MTEFLIGILFLGITEINAPSSVNTNFLPNISVKERQEQLSYSSGENSPELFVQELCTETNLSHAHQGGKLR